MDNKRVVDFERDYSKKVKVIGEQQYLNPDTGELQTMNVISIQDRDFNFSKVWMQHVFYSLGLIGNQKTKLAFWILDQMDSNNKLCMSYRQISDGSGVSYQTVMYTMQSLIDSNFLIRLSAGAYQVNPSVIWKGSHNRRMNVLYQYQDVKNNGFYSVKNERTEENEEV